MSIKKNLSVFLALMLTICLVFSVSAAAASSSVNVGLNDNAYSTVYSAGNSYVAYAFLAGGSLPQGMSVMTNGGDVVIYGAPTSVGSYTAILSVGVPSGNTVQEYVVPVTINVSGSGSSYSQGGSNIVVATPDNPYSGVVLAPVVTPTNTAPVLTKSPTSEVVDEGQSAVFVARADNTNFVSWYLVSPDMATRYPASSIGSYFVGASATGYDTERLVLSNIPDSLDGWMVEAQFENGVGTTWSNAAYISVNPKEEPSPTPTPTPAPTPTPTPAPTPTPTPATTTYVNGTAVQNGTSGTGSSGGASGFGSTINNYNSDNTAIGNAATATEPSNVQYNMPPTTTTSAGTGNGSSGISRNSSHIGAYLLAVVAGAVIIGAVLIMALYMKGKISLGGLEKMLDEKNNDQMFDDGSAYYNPDDFKDNNSHSV